MRNDCEEEKRAAMLKECDVRYALWVLCAPIVDSGGFGDGHSDRTIGVGCALGHDGNSSRLCADRR